MARHSKWHNIQVRKGKQDKTRSATFTKLARLITVAARQGGGNLEMNFSLRLAVDKAKEANMPKDNIERAIKRGTGELNDGTTLDELTYEGFGPGGAVLIVEIMTDNKNRSAGDIKNVFNKHGGTMAGPGSVQWQFERVRAEAGFTWEPKQTVTLPPEDEAKLAELIGALEEHDDVKAVYVNITIYLFK